MTSSRCAGTLEHVHGMTAQESSWTTPLANRTRETTAIEAIERMAM
jgi:hypothetical protein